MTLALAVAVATPALAQPATDANPTIPADANKRSERVLTAQILLDHARHSPGVIDGIMGANTRRAIKAYQEANGMPATGQIDTALLNSLSAHASGDLLTTYTIRSEDVRGPFRTIPSSMTGKANLDRVAYESPAEALAEKFHMARSFLEALNPNSDFGRKGTTIRVVRPGSDDLSTQVRRVEVDKGANELRAFTGDGRLVATYPTTVGSSIHPSPNDTLEVLAVAPDPTYFFDPAGRTWGPERELTIAPGPNNPVGTVWIDLSRDGYGIHGTPEPRLIGKTDSHGCVRLTNWDAEELSGAIEKGATVHFV